MNKLVCIILARGGSKGIPHKNIVDFCGKPLISWTIEQSLQSEQFNSVWVSSDSAEILEISESYGARSIIRPDSLSDHHATSESAWLHAIDVIENRIGAIDLVFAPQVTSPLREPKDIIRGIEDFQRQGYDSLFSCSVVDDLFLWEKTPEGRFESVNYDYLNRSRRQDIPDQYVENGSFYIFKPKVIRKFNNRIGGKIGVTNMELWKLFEIDTMDDLKMCEAMMKAFLL